MFDLTVEDPALDPDAIEIPLDIDLAEDQAAILGVSMMGLPPLQRYEVHELVGEGAMGRIFRASDHVLQREVALKVMRPDIPVCERKRFRREAILGARLLHPGLVQIYDMGMSSEVDDEWFAMELLYGVDLQQVIDSVREQGRWIAWSTIKDAFGRILAVLQYLHESGVVHRDVKPANMFLTRDPNTDHSSAKLLDLGVALDLDDPWTTQALCGDPNYMAPEQTELNARVDHRSDIYSAGMSLYELVTGHLPFAGLCTAPLNALLTAQREAQPPRASSLMPQGTPAIRARAVDAFINSACAKSPDERYQNVSEMLEAFARIP